MTESDAYGNTIYMWLGTPVICLSIFGFMVNRGLRKRALLEANDPHSADLTDINSQRSPENS